MRDPCGVRSPYAVITGCLKTSCHENHSQLKEPHLVSPAVWSRVLQMLSSSLMSQICRRGRDQKAVQIKWSKPPKSKWQKCAAGSRVQRSGLMMSNVELQVCSIIIWRRFGTWTSEHAKLYSSSNPANNTHVWKLNQSCAETEDKHAFEDKEARH